MAKIKTLELDLIIDDTDKAQLAAPDLLENFQLIDQRAFEIRQTLEAQSGSGGTSSSFLVNVKDHGAKGDGTTNDASAFQAAINTAASWVNDQTHAGALVQVPPGTYNIGATLVNKAGVVIRGAGKKATVLRRTGNHILIDASGTDFNNRLLDAGLQDLELNSTSVARGTWTTPLLRLYYTQFFHLRNVNFRRAGGSAISAMTWFDGEISNCRFDYCGADGFPAVHLKNSDQGVASGFGYSADSCNNLYFVNCTWEQNPGIDIHFDGRQHDGTYNASRRQNMCRIFGGKFENATTSERLDTPRVLLENTAHFGIYDVLVSARGTVSGNATDWVVLKNTYNTYISRYTAVATEAPTQAMRTGLSLQGGNVGLELGMVVGTVQTTNRPSVALVEYTGTNTDINTGRIYYDNNPASAAVVSGVPTSTTAAVRKGELVLNVRDRGVKGDGTEEGAAIQAAINTASAGSTVYFPKGVYKTNTQLTVLSDDVKFQLAPGAVIDGSGRTTGGVILKVGRTDPTTTTTVSTGATLGSKTVTVASSTGFAVGDYVKLTSTEVFNSERPTDYKKGEYARINSISGASITFEAPLVATYDTSSFVLTLSKMDPVKRFSINGGLIRGGGTAGQHYGISLQSVTDARVTNVSFESCAQTGVHHRDALGLLVSGCHVYGADMDVTGYGMTGSGENIRYLGNHAERCRHGFDTSSSATSPPIRNVTMSNNTVKDCRSSGISTHGGTEGVTITGNTVIQCGGGIVTRSPKTTIKGNTVIGGLTSTQSSQTYGHGIWLADNSGVAPGQSSPAGTDVIVEGNIIAMHGAYTTENYNGITCTAPLVRSRISGNTISGFSNHGVHLLGHTNSDSEVSNNIIDCSSQLSGTRYGILVHNPNGATGQSSQRVRVTENIITAPITTGIRFEGGFDSSSRSNGIIVDSNTVKGYGSNGIALSSGFYGPGCRVTDNYFPDATALGATTSATATVYINPAQFSGQPLVSGNMIGGAANRFVVPTYTTVGDGPDPNAVTTQDVAFLTSTKRVNPDKIIEQSLVAYSFYSGTPTNAGSFQAGSAEAYVFANGTADWTMPTLGFEGIAKGDGDNAARTIQTVIGNQGTAIANGVVKVTNLIALRARGPKSDGGTPVVDKAISFDIQEPIVGTTRYSLFGIGRHRFRKGATTGGATNTVEVATNADVLQWSITDTQVTGYASDGTSKRVILDSADAPTDTRIKSHLFGATTAKHLSVTKDGTEVLSIGIDGRLVSTAPILPGRYTSGARPSASTAGEGAIIFDTTIDRTLVSDGTNWIEDFTATERTRLANSEYVILEVNGTYPPRPSVTLVPAGLARYKGVNTPVDWLPLDTHEVPVT